jgi:AcrR family transcriptional regulator
VSRVEDPPARGTRPRNRREIILQAAGELFYRRGYPNVSMSDIARETNVGASAIYRHFRSKSELLVEAIQSGIASYQTIVDQATDLDDVLRQSAECALENRTLGVLWQREARNLDLVDLKLMRERLSSVTRGLSRFITDARPGIDRTDTDLLAWCTMGALVSVGFHSLSLPRDEYVDLLVAISHIIVGIDLRHDVEVATGGERPQDDPESRRDVLVSHATQLFAERGYGAVGIDDIGDSVGIAGPSIYSHFESKQKILAEAVTRGNEVLRSEATVVLEAGETPQVTLGRLVASFVGVAVHNRFVIRIVMSELDQLEPADRDYARREQREYIDTWCALLRQYTDVEQVAARIRVQAVLLVVNDAVQTPHLRSQPGFEARLRDVALAMLGLTWSVPLDS